ncbi:MAG: type II toxin-antitoxin system VapC family toxin [Thermoproteota archaeon]|nr:type II toxin-antitoxin system VapC family toxin [Candidatus Brockarchaeota archaeon]
MGERILVDTDCLIDYYKGELELNPDDSHHISEITVYEFIRGTKNIKEAKRILEESFFIVWLDNEILEKASEIWRALKASGRLVEDRDLIIGATAMVKRLKLLTRNTKHYDVLKAYGLAFYR